MQKDSLERGLVIKSTGSWYLLELPDGRTVECKMRGKYRMKGIKSTNPVTVGDVALFEWDERGEIGLIKDIEERKNYIVRKSTNLSKQSHVIAANIDLAVLVITIASPEVKPEFIDRFLITAQAYRIPVLIVINKTDLYSPEETEVMHQLTDIYKKIGYDVHQMSVAKGENVEEFKAIIKDKKCLISGNSGVGKSTLINTIDPGIKQKITKISDTHKQGVHTTTFAEMFKLPQGGYLIDTPGIRGFGLVNIEKEELFHFFPEIFKASKDCKFHNCSHTHEKDCAVKDAVENGDIHLLRYQNYLSMYMSDGERYRQNNY